MITCFYCSRNENPQFKEKILKTCGLKNVEIIEYVNNNEGLTKPYNIGLDKASYDIVVFLHDDIEFNTKNWGRKIIKLFNKYNEYGIIGVAGTKYLDSDSIWWKHKKKLYGQVYHGSNKLKWLSKYSEYQSDLIDVVTVDGLFICVNKNKIVKKFNENLEGFHFYDIDFCVNNYINGCKIGLTHEISLLHYSIGLTDENWEKNRKQFIDIYINYLPLKINETFEKRKLNVLLGCLSFSNLTGSELMTLDLAIGLSKMNCNVSVISGNISNSFNLLCKQNNIKTYLFSEPPGYKLGDGKWSYFDKNEMIKSVKGVLYNVEDVQFDIIHASHKPVIEQLLKLYPNIPIIQTVNSEIIDLENPVIHSNVKKYISVRPSITEYLIKEFNIDNDKIRLIYNPINNQKFKKTNNPKNPVPIILFVGTLDYLRKNAIYDLIKICKDDKKILYLVGNDYMGYGKDLANKYDFVKYFEPTIKIENYYHLCDATAGIMLGRTTIEGFLCGKPGYIYTVDKSGNILNREFVEVPNDLQQFDYNLILNEIKKLYIEIFNL